MKFFLFTIFLIFCFFINSEDFLKIYYFNSPPFYISERLSQKNYNDMPQNVKDKNISNIPQSIKNENIPNTYQNIEDKKNHNISQNIEGKNITDNKSNNIENNNNAVNGIIVDIVKKIFTDAKIKYEFIEVPNKRVEEYIKNGHYACGIGWFKTSEREKFAIFSEPIYQDEKLMIIINKQAASYLPENPSIKDILTSNLVAGLIDGFSYGKWADENINKYHPGINRITTEQMKLIQMISTNRFNYTFISKEEGEWVIKSSKDFGKTLKIVPIKDAPEGNLRYIMFSKTVKKETIEKINASIRKFNLVRK